MPPRGDRRASPTTRALVMHAALLKYKPGTMRRWIEEDNRGVKILGIRWLLREDRSGHVAGILVLRGVASLQWRAPKTTMQILPVPSKFAEDPDTPPNQVPETFDNFLAQLGWNQPLEPTLHSTLAQNWSKQATKC